MKAIFCEKKGVDEFTWFEEQDISKGAKTQQGIYNNPLRLSVFAKYFI